jgi:hypothetical protein
MNSSFIQLSDLPDEIFLIILKNISNIEVLYSLIGVNKRLDKIVHDYSFTHHLNLLRILPSHLTEIIPVSKYCILPLPDPILDRFCLEILPEIHFKIKCLKLESFSMKRILLAAKYPNLFGLGLYGIQGERAIDLFSGKIYVT